MGGWLVVKAVFRIAYRNNVKRKEKMNKGKRIYFLTQSEDETLLGKKFIPLSRKFKN